MLFNSFVYAVFLPTVVGLYWLLPKRAQNRMLLAASYLFYGWWDWRFLTLILISTVLDYQVGRRLHRESAHSSVASDRRRKRLLWLSIGGNLGILGFFKYFNFFAGSLAGALSTLGIAVEPIYLRLVLPVGISFYTFQTLSYTLDIYRGQMKPMDDFLDFALYVAFFPQLVAGPIERARVLLPQIAARRHFDTDRFLDGLHLVFWGLFKKVYVADNLGPYIDQVFAPGSSPSATAVILGGAAFTFQIYCDFSGYSDIARGSAKLLGFDLMVNFRHPFRAANPSEFWQRWHISLSTWLRDYLYIPLGGSRAGVLMTYRNLALTMLLGGLWHGATWLFVVWGAYHGALLITHRLLQPSMQRIGAHVSFARTSLWHGMKVLAMFQWVAIGSIIFRVRSLGQLGHMLTAVLTLRGPVDLSLLGPLLVFAGPLYLLELVEYALGRVDDLNRAPMIPAWVKTSSYATLFYLFAFHGATASSFIYFAF